MLNLKQAVKKLKSRRASAVYGDSLCLLIHDDGSGCIDTVSDVFVFAFDNLEELEAWLNDLWKLKS